MQTGQHKCIQLLTLLFIRGNQDLCNRIIDICLIFQSLLCRKISINRSAHRRQGGLRVIRSSPADIKYHVKVSSLHTITVRLFFLSMNVQGDTQLLVFALEVLRNRFFRHTIAVIKQLQSIFWPSFSRTPSPANVQPASSSIFVASSTSYSYGVRLNRSKER